MKKFFGFLAISFIVASSAFAQIPSVISCSEYSSDSKVFYTFEFRQTQENRSYLDFFIWERGENGEETRSSITAQGTHDAKDPNLFRLVDGGFVRYDSNSNEVTFQISALGTDMAQIVGFCELPEPGAGTGN